MSDTWTIYTDGGSRGNPGPAAYAYVIKRPGQPDIQEMAYLGQSTNNIAEYTGLVKALEHAQELGGKTLIVNSDSELMVKQMNGQYKVKNEGLRPLYEQASRLRKRFESVTIKHIYRGQNSQADALCNEAMDNRSPAARMAREPEALARDGASLASASGSRPLTPLARSLEILKQSAVAWAKSGDPNDPPPAEVWNRICEIMQAEDAD